MKIVLDSNVAVALVIELPYSEVSLQKMHFWQTEDTQIVVPSLWVYEIASVLRKIEALGHLSSGESKKALQALFALGFEIIPPDESLIYSAYNWAKRLGQTVAYDAAFLALAEQEGVPFWTADRRFVRATQKAGLDWVHHIEET